MIMSNSIQLFQKFGLVNSQVSYSEIANAFLTSGYVSGLGHTYFSSVRVAEGLLIKDNIGEAHWGTTYLNHVSIYSVKDKVLIAEGNFHALPYSKERVKDIAKRLLLQTLKEAAADSNESLDENEANRIIDKVLNQAMNEDQRQLLIKQTQKYLK
jgi:hypothetical protein